MSSNQNGQKVREKKYTETHNIKNVQCTRKFTQKKHFETSLPSKSILLINTYKQEVREKSNAFKHTPRKCRCLHHENRREYMKSGDSIDEGSRLSHNSPIFLAWTPSHLQTSVHRGSSRRPHLESFVFFPFLCLL